MIVNSSEFGISGERDSDGYCGYYRIGTEYLVVDGADVLVGLRFIGCPDEVVVVAWRRRGQELPLSAQPTDSFLRAALTQLLQMEGVQRVKVLPGAAVTIEDITGA